MMRGRCNHPQGDLRWALADPICTFIFAALVLLTTRGIIADIIHILMERTPVSHDVVEMMRAMGEVGRHIERLCARAL